MYISSNEVRFEGVHIEIGEVLWNSLDHVKVGPNLFEINCPRESSHAAGLVINSVRFNIARFLF